MNCGWPLYRQPYQAIAAVFDELCEKAKSLEGEIATAEQQRNSMKDTESAVDTAMKIIHQLNELAASSEDLGAARQIFAMLNAQLFLSFSPVRMKKRTLNKVCGGVVTFGDASPQIEIYGSTV